MNRPSMERFEATLIPGGTLFYNSTLIEVQPKRTDIQVVAVPANAIASELGNSRVANMVMMGAILKHTGIVHADTVMNVLTAKVLTGKKKDLVTINRAALDKGMELA